MSGAPHLGFVLCLVLAGVVTRPARAQPEETSEAAEGGRVSGRVVDAASGEPIPGATVQVVGRKTVAQTAADGRFTVDLPPGTYQLRFSAPAYRSAGLDAVRVEVGKIVSTQAKLPPVPKTPGGIVMDVIRRLRRAAESVQLARRKAASAVTETISAETMKKSAGADATAAVQRATGVTVRESGGSKTVFVRGLGDRYTSGLLNGSRLPSPDALRRAVPLDLFPSDFLEGIDVVKGFTPDLPGDFAGGLVDMRLRDFPDTLTYSVGLSTGANSQTTTQRFLTYEGAGARDYFGMGEGFRNPPSSVPPYSLEELSNRQRYSVARDFKNIWNLKTRQAPPDWGASLQVGNSLGPIGFQLGGVYNTRFRTVRNRISRQFQDGGNEIRDDFRTNLGTMQTRLGGVFTGSWRIADGHSLSLRSFVNRSSGDETRTDSGTDAQGQNIDSWRLRYVEDELAYGQLAGEHRFDRLSVGWRTVLARTTRDEPDTRHVTYQNGQFVNENLGGLRISNETREDITDSALDVTVPFAVPLGGAGDSPWRELAGKLKLGPAYSFRDRSFNQRRFEFGPVNELSVDTRQPPEDIFAPENIGPGAVDVTEQTRPSDTFKGTHEIIGGYGMLDLPIITDRLRLVGGARVEYSLIRLDITTLDQARCPPDEPTCKIQIPKKNVDPLPSANLIFNPRKDMNVRLSWSRTVSRPELRELANAFFPAQRGERATVGNPGLVQYGIENWDARWEWFPSPLELLSVGFFYKDLESPIEKFGTASQGDPFDTFFNVKSGTMYGVEVEARKNLGALAPWLDKVMFGLNGTWIESEADVGRRLVYVGSNGSFDVIPTARKRGLQGTPPFVVAANVEYANPDWVTARLDYSTAGRTLDSAGGDNLPDIYEERRDRLAFVAIVPLKRYLRGAPLTAKFSVDNILNDDISYTRGQGTDPTVPRTYRRYTDGVSFGFGLSYAF